MALIMLAIGGLMALVGVYAMASGFPVIEVERGWSMVISGAVLLSGGLIVAALGIVVRTLNGLKDGFPAAGSAAHAEPTLAASVAAPHASEPPAFDEPVPAYAVAAPAVLAAGVGYAGLHEAAPHEAVVEPQQEPELETQAPEEPLEHPSPEPLVTAPVGLEPARREMFEHKPFRQTWHEPDFSAFDLDAPHEPPASGPEPAPETEPHASEPQEVPSASDSVAPLEPESAAVAVPEPAAEPVAVHAPEPVAEAPATAPETPPGNLSVIGRYDSDGTSYVMYSDGSIEAQSETGVFRFNSMAELKAFIEG